MRVTTTLSNIKVLYEDNHLIAINKRSGDIVQGDKTGDRPLSEWVKAYLKDKYQKQGNVFTGVIHRIDRPVTGVVLFAKTGKALGRMNALLQQKKVQKTYLAIVENKPPAKESELIHYLKKNPKNNKSYGYLTPKEDHKKSVLNYRFVRSGTHYHLLEIKPKTGRHHQIRVQLASIGCIIKGDLKYGAKRSNPDGSIALHASEIEFIHPVKNELLKIIAPVPDNFLWQSLVNPSEIKES